MRNHTKSHHPNLTYIPTPNTPMNTFLLRLMVTTDMSFHLIQNPDFQTIARAAGCTILNRMSLRQKWMNSPNTSALN